MTTTLPTLITRLPESFARSKISMFAPPRLATHESSFRQTLAKAGLSEKNNFKAKNSDTKPDFRARTAIDDGRESTIHEVDRQDSAARIDSKDTHPAERNQSGIEEQGENNSERAAGTTSAETAPNPAQGNQDEAQNQPSNANVTQVGTPVRVLPSELSLIQSFVAGQLSTEPTPTTNTVSGNTGPLDPGIIMMPDHTESGGGTGPGVKPIMTDIQDIRTFQNQVVADEKPDIATQGQLLNNLSTSSEPARIETQVERAVIEQTTRLRSMATTPVTTIQSGQESGERVQNTDGPGRGISSAPANNPISDLAGKQHDPGRQSQENSDRSESQPRTNPAQSRAQQVDAAVRLENATGQPANLAAATQASLNKVATMTVDAGGQTNNQGIEGSPSLTNRLEGPEGSRMMSRVMRSLTTMMNQRGGVMNIRLDPPELGELRIQMVLGRGSVSATFEATNEQTQAMLNKNLSALRTALESQGLTVERLHVQVNQGSGAQTQAEDATDDQSRHGGSGQGENQQSDRQDGDSGDHLRGKSEFSSLLDGLENFSLEQLSGTTVQGDKAA